MGPVGRLKLIGLSLTREQTHADSNTIMLTPEGVQRDTINAAPLDFRRQKVARVNLLVGMRAIRFVTVQGFDALTGTQDVRVGAQVGLVGGQSVRLGPDYDRDRFFSSNVYIGAGNEQWFMAVQGITEARYDLETQRLRNIISSGHAAWYFRPAIRQTTILEANWATGRRMQSPFQVSLADPDGGVMGHRDSRDPGARRLVLRGEQRLVVPTRFNVADMGLAAFVEAGRLWAERSVPYSVDSPGAARWVCRCLPPCRRGHVVSGASISACRSRAIPVDASRCASRASIGAARSGGTQRCDDLERKDGTVQFVHVALMN